MIILIFSALFLALSPAQAQVRYRASDPLEEPAQEEDVLSQPLNPASLDVSRTQPTYISLAPNINDFGRFADSGAHANWFIGFNNAWIVKLPPMVARGSQRAYIGAKLGRAKARPKPGSPWELSVIPGKIYMAISQRPSFSPDQQFFLVHTEDVPLEADNNTYMPGVGASQWFWAEVPLHLVSARSPNYLIIWSPAREFRDADSSPILAAMESFANDSADEPSAWNNQAIQGVPPRAEAGALQVPIKLKPALAIKLVPAAAERKLVVDSFASQSLGEDILLQFSVQGRDVELAWIELSQDELEWDRVSRYVRQPPYLLTLPRRALPPRGGYLRAKARDLLGVEGHSRTIFISAHGAR